MTDRKTWTVKLFKGADADPTYKRLTNFTEGTEYVFAHTYDKDGKANYTRLLPCYQMSSASIVVPGRPIDFDLKNIDYYDVYECNYLIATAEWDPQKFYFGFINSIEYVNDGVAKVNWTIDFWATYKDKLNLAKPQLVERAQYTPKSYMLDARRTVDAALPTDKKQRLAFAADLFNVPTAGQSDNDSVKFSNWYLFYVMPKSDLNSVFSENQPTADKSDYETKTDDFKPDTLRDLSKEHDITDANAIKKETHTVSWLKLDDKFKSITVDETKIDWLVRTANVEIYASDKLNDVLKLSLISGEGFAVIGCEVRSVLDLGNFEKMGNGLYHFTKNGGSTNDYFYEADTGVNSYDQPTFSNDFDKNHYREELSVAGKNFEVEVDPSLRFTANPVVHVFDSVMSGFKPIYSFYMVNGQLDYFKPGEACESDLTATVDLDRSVPLYGNQALAYFLSHMNRINAEIQKQIIGWQGQVKNSQLAFANNLETIAKNYDISLLDLKNSLWNGKQLAKLNNDADVSLLNNNNALQKANMEANNKIDKQILQANQATAKSNMTDSNTLASANLERSQANALTNIDATNSTATANLKASQATQITNIMTSNKAAQDTTKASNANAVANNKANAEQNKSNLDTNLDNQNANLELQKAESFVTGLNLTAGIAKFLTGALTSLITGFLDIETAEKVAQNNVNTQKKIIDDNLKLQNSTILQNNLDLALSNLNTNYQANLTNTNKSNSTALSNLANSQKTAKDNLSRSNQVAKTNLINSQTTALGNLDRSNQNALSNFDDNFTKAINSLELSYNMSGASISNAYTKAINSLTQNNNLSKVNLENSAVKAYILAKMAQNLSQEQLNNNFITAVASYVRGLKAEMEDWTRGNITKLTDGQGLANEVLELSHAWDKVYEVQASTERQIQDQIFTNGALIKRKISLKRLISPGNDDSEWYNYYMERQDNWPQVTHSTEYLDNVMYIRQYVQTENCQLEGSVPAKALQTLQNAFNNGVYLTIDRYGSYKDGVKEISNDGNPWNYYESAGNGALSSVSDPLVATRYQYDKKIN